jgi:hypothetical protein
MRPASPPPSIGRCSPLSRSYLLGQRLTAPSPAGAPPGQRLRSGGYMAAIGKRGNKISSNQSVHALRGTPFGYVTGVLRTGENVPLCRLRYGGSAHSFGFAIYSAARDRYQDAILLTGLPAGTPQEALDTACTVHLAGLGHEPGT